jgi:hypothetical protein
MGRLATSDVIARLDAKVASFVAPLLDDCEDVEVIEGDHAVDALELGEPTVVFGSLRATRGISTWEHAHLIVLGDLTVDILDGTAGLYVRGDLRAAQLVYLCSGNDYSALIEGTLDTPLVIENGTHTTVRACTGRVISTHNRFLVGGERVPHTEDDEPLLRTLLVPEVFEPDERGNGGLHENLSTFALDGLRVLR